MTDPRPSENQDGPLKLPEMRRRGFFDDVPTGDDFFGADEQPSLGWETADAQHIVAALDRLTEQQRVANLIAWTTRDGYRPTTEVQAQIEMGLRL